MLTNHFSSEQGLRKRRFFFLVCVSDGPDWFSHWLAVQGKSFGQNEVNTWYARNAFTISVLQWNLDRGILWYILGWIMSAPKGIASCTRARKFMILWRTVAKTPHRLICCFFSRVFFFGIWNCVQRSNITAISIFQTAVEDVLRHGAPLFLRCPCK